MMKIKKGVLICLFLLTAFLAWAKSDLMQSWFAAYVGPSASRTTFLIKHRDSVPEGAQVTSPRVRESVNLTPASSQPIPTELIGRRLLATFQVDDAELASAVIYTEGYGAYRYRVGGELPEGATLVAIKTDSVLLEQDGRLFSVAMDLTVASSFGSDEGTAILDTELEDTAPEYFSRFSEEARKFIEQFDLRPVRENFPEGYIIGDKFTELGVDYLGIQPGDIVISVNGYPVGEYESDYLVWLSFRSTQKASVVIRGEQGEFTIHYPEEVFVRQRTTTQ